MRVEDNYTKENNQDFSIIGTWGNQFFISYTIGE